MAEGTTKKDVCQFYLYSACKNGSKCAYSHDNTRKCSSVPCRFFLSGSCMYGEKCWFLHSKPKVEEISLSKSQFSMPSNNSIKTRDLRLSDTLRDSPPNWVNAQEFIPKSADDSRSYADTLKTNAMSSPVELCSQFMVEGRCDYYEKCAFVHGDFCDMCQCYCLNPLDEMQRKCHAEWCVKELERDMELSFAISESENKSCGICMDVVKDKFPLSERRFGILENCSHVFCLSCIRQWRQMSFERTQQDDPDDVTRVCPECRTLSHFIVPSQFWVDAGEAKKTLISEYKSSLSKKQCKYFKQGSGVCPFGNSCFYLHSNPDGTKVDLPPVRRRQNQDGELDYIERPILWDFLEARDNLEDDQIIF